MFRYPNSFIKSSLNILFITILIFQIGCNRETDKNKTIRLYAGAGLRKGVDALVSEFTKQTGIKVDVDYGGSGMIITRAREDQSADLFMPGDVWYVEQLEKKEGIIESQTSVASFVPVIITRKGNPLRILGLKDLLRKDIKVAVGNSKSCQIGRITMKILKKNKLNTKDLSVKVGLTVNELGVWVKMKDVDTAIVWDAIAANILKDIEVITIPKEKNIISKVVIGVLKGSKNKNLAYKFINFIVSEKGKEILRSKGYRINDE